MAHSDNIHAVTESTSAKHGFTLIELSIVLVIIGLITGGILTGQDLINVATIRAQVSQIEKYHTATETFRNKYGYLPGDIPNSYASNFGFQTRGSLQGEGDGNGVIEANCWNTSGHGSYAFQNGCGELAVFWEDLSEAGLIDATILGFDTGGANYPNISGPAASGRNLTTKPSIYQWMPSAKIGNTTFVYVYGISGINYFAISTIDAIGWAIQSALNPGITVLQAYNIDKKTDDGLPQSGSITACYVNYNVVNYASIYAAGNNQQGANGSSSSTYTNNCVPTTTATAYASSNCFDNNGTAGTQTYSLSQNANVQNCALSFRFQ